MAKPVAINNYFMKVLNILSAFRRAESDYTQAYNKKGAKLYRMELKHTGLNGVTIGEVHGFEISRREKVCFIGCVSCLLNK